ncbi:large ribosomal subunit protein mL65 [Centruroides vittatus]|uniref:large ribosomal subunit protein mL65 n=1 Tax=Centruroides vittatus TaxID=120091 RepID=UPI0035103F4D
MHIYKARVMMSVKGCVTYDVRRRYLKTFTNLLKYITRSCSSAAKTDYVDVPQYPPIRPHGREGNRRYQRQLWYDHIKQLPTAEEKLLELTAYDKRYMAIVRPSTPVYNALPLYQYYTRTRFIEGLPENFRNVEIMEDEYENVKAHFLEKLKKSYLRIQTDDPVEKECLGGNFAFHQAVSTIMPAMNKQYSHLLKAQVAFKPRCESFWWKSNIHSESFYKSRYKKDFMDVNFQFIDEPAYQLRTDEPLSPIVPLEDPLCKFSEDNIPMFNYHPKYQGYEYDKRYPSSVPGVWPGSPYKFPLMSFHNMRDLANTEVIIHEKDRKVRLDAYGLIVSYGWLMGIATHLGFTPFHELTYPLVTQTVVSNGKLWAFFIYQLNTIGLHSDIDNNSLQNLCWSSGPMELFDVIENNEFKGLNEDVFKILYKFFINRPYYTKGLNLTPYLSEDKRSEEEIYQTKLKLRQLYENRISDYEMLQEIPIWKRIYWKRPMALPSIWLK